VQIAEYKMQKKTETKDETRSFCINEELAHSLTRHRFAISLVIALVKRCHIILDRLVLISIVKIL